MIHYPEKPWNSDAPVREGGHASFQRKIVAHGQLRTLTIHLLNEWPVQDFVEIQVCDV